MMQHRIEKILKILIDSCNTEWDLGKLEQELKLAAMEVANKRFQQRQKNFQQQKDVFQK